MGPEKEQLPMMERRFGVKNTKWVGFAPFARHKGKIYPLEKSEIVLAELCADRRITVFVFGGGKEERAQINVWKKKFPEIVLPEKMSLQEEVELMSCLDVVLTMDSANMHLASLAHANVLSIWGATHPYAGFYGLFQSERNAIQTSLSCRPCSIYGNKPCYRGDYACMHNIDPMTIVEKIKTEISLL
jgi:ADP-heptose:LPS heptosyltransferase